MMWKDSVNLGCGVYICPDNNYAIYTCHYSPAGNVKGGTMFRINNFKELCQAEKNTWTTCNKGLKTPGCSQMNGKAQNGKPNRAVSNPQVSPALLVIAVCGIYGISIMNHDFADMGISKV
ncbi:uncharacterized protein LOC134856877 [Symsagittifera roscoffensis]|uniref:uncharacterized protein LOC134856877 n=1 Tax=Symsagittifera roscoffensis TaxID=84072 RepID=UPI00307B6124